MIRGLALAGAWISSPPHVLTSTHCQWILFFFWAGLRNTFDGSFGCAIMGILAVWALGAKVDRSICKSLNAPFQRPSLVWSITSFKIHAGGGLVSVVNSPSIGLCPGHEREGILLSIYDKLPTADILFECPSWSPQRIYQATYNEDFKFVKSSVELAMWNHTIVIFNCN